jgi:hypothetical protein
MDDTEVVDLDVGVMVEKRGRGLPHGSKNKSKVSSMAVSSSSTLVNGTPVIRWEVRTNLNLLLLLPMSHWMQMLHAAILLLHLLEIYFLLSLLRVLNVVSNIVCL